MHGLLAAAWVALGMSPVGTPEARSADEPPEGSSKLVMNGYKAFKTHCVACHSVNGVGGRVGPELNYPSSVVEYIKPEWLRRWILDPTAVRHRTQMPGLPRLLPRRERLAHQIVGYLEAMAARKVPPVDP